MHWPKPTQRFLRARQINFRIGVHVGDVMVRAGDLFGDGVNIAARLQTLAKAGGLCVSGVTYDQVRKILPLELHGPRCADGQEHRGAHTRL